MFEVQVKIPRMGAHGMQSDFNLILFTMLIVLVSCVAPAAVSDSNPSTTVTVTRSANEDNSSISFQTTQTLHATTQSEMVSSSTIMSTKTLTTELLSTTTKQHQATTAITTRQSPTTREQSVTTGQSLSTTSETVSIHDSSAGSITKVTTDYTSTEPTTDSELVSSTSPGQSTDDTYNIFSIFKGHDTVTMVAVPVVFGLVGAFFITAVACWVKRCRRGSNRRERFRLLRSEERSGGNLLDGSSEDEF